MNHLDLFSGIGGFSLAAEWVWGEEHNIIAFCEKDKYCRKKLKKLWPNVPIYKDITRLNGKEITETIDLLTAGIPCQPASVAGKQRGTKDDRWLWPEAHRIVRETHPKWVIFENVNGLLTLNNGLEFDNVLSDLEGEGYEIQTFNIPACGVDARHRRERVWIVANSEAERSQGLGTGGEQITEAHGRKKFSMCDGSDRAIWPVEPNVDRVAHGIPNRAHRLKALGNAIVPQVAEVIMRGIKELEDLT